MYKKWFSENKKKELHENKCLKNTNLGLVKMTKSIQDLRLEFHKEIEALMRTRAEMKMKLKSPSNSTRKLI